MDYAFCQEMLQKDCILEIKIGIGMKWIRAKQVGRARQVLKVSEIDKRK